MIHTIRGLALYAAMRDIVVSNPAIRYLGNMMSFLTHAGYRWHPAFSIVLLCMLLTLFAGCQKQDAVIAGLDIPIPSQMKKVPDKFFEPSPGLEDGQAAFQGKADAGEIFNFYQENMEARGWKPTNFMVSQKNQLAYIKGNRICLVWYAPSPDGTISLLIMIGSSKPPA